MGLTTGAPFSPYTVSLGGYRASRMGTAYMHVLMYAIHKMESMVGKCEVENAEGNAAAMHA